MDGVLRAAAIYLILLVLFRISGKRTLSQATTFDFVLLLILAEATQQALLGEDFSITQAALVITTLIALDRVADYFGFRFPRFDRITESVPLLLVEDGKLLRDRLRRENISPEEILSAARQSQGIARLDQIRYAVLERSGGISVVTYDATP